MASFNGRLWSSGQADENGCCGASIVSIPAKRIDFAEQAVKAYGTMVDSKISAAMKRENDELLHGQCSCSPSLS